MPAKAAREKTAGVSHRNTHPGRMDRVTSQGSSYALEEIPTDPISIYHPVHYLSPARPRTLCRLLTALQSLEMSAIGGHGSRGLGKIKFGLWPLTSTNCIAAELAAGIELKWRPHSYYLKGSGESIVVASDEKLQIADVISQSDRVQAAVK